MLGSQSSEHVAGRHRVECSEGARLILRIRRDPSLQERPDEAEVARFRALLEECEGPTAVVRSKRIGDLQHSGLERRFRGRKRANQPKGQFHVTGADRLR